MEARLKVTFAVNDHDFEGPLISLVKDFGSLM